MRNVHYADGAVHQDNHQELNIHGNFEEATLQRLIQDFLAHPQEAFVMNEPANCREVCNVPPDEELFHFIHPEKGADEELSIHLQIKRLVTRFGVQEICQYLNQLAQENKIFLPQSVEVAYNEMKRMGMPEVEGYSYKTFAKYYRK